eukprot:7629349-Karenia_brevis.AAC.1
MAASDNESSARSGSSAKDANQCNQMLPVTLQGLVARADLNGTQAHVINFDTEIRMFRCFVEGEGTVMNVMPANIQWTYSSSSDHLPTPHGMPVSFRP